MSLALAAGTVSSVIFAASNLPMLVKARRTRDLSSYSLAYLVLNNVGNVLYCLYVYDLPPGPIWAMQSFYLLSMALLLRWYLRFTHEPGLDALSPATAAQTRSPPKSPRPVVVFAAPANRGRPLAMGSGPSLPVNLGRLHAVCRIRGRGIDTHVTRPSWTGSLGEGQRRPAATKPRPRRAHAHSRPIRIHGHRRRSSSGAAVAGSPLSGGYAGLKATIRFITAYAATESERAGLGIKFTAVLPQLTPAADLGAAGSPPTRPGKDWTSPPPSNDSARPSPRSRWASRSSSSSPTRASIATAYLLTAAGLAPVT